MEVLPAKREFWTNKLGYAPRVDGQQIPSYYMGKNTPERKDYIMENLIVPVEPVEPVEE